MQILVVDDEKNLRLSIAEFLSLENIETRQAENGLSAQRLLQEERFDAAVVDLRMPGLDGLELLSWIKNEGPVLPVLMISAYGDVQDAVSAMKLGAADYLVKPFDPEELLLRVRRAVDEHRLREAATARAEPTEPMDSPDPAMQNVLMVADKVAPTDSTVLITGESGTGKEVLAKRIHALSRRTVGPFRPINIGGVPDSLLESELFGYEKGAFTGADRRKPGLFELAAGGTLFLDEIGDMPQHLQVKLLRVLQDRRIQRLGGTSPIPIDVRIIAATNRNLETAVRDGAFREDLFYRLNVIRLELPPLRDRPAEIPVLAGRFVKAVSRRVGKTVDAVSADALRLLSSYPFPGNIRELENVVERAVILSEGRVLEPRDFAIEPSQRTARVPKPGTLRELEREAIVAALHRHEGKRRAASEELGISRRTLLNKIKEYEIEGF